MSLQCTNIFLYADDILLVAPSVHLLREMLNYCETELMWLDMSSRSMPVLALIEKIMFFKKQVIILYGIYSIKNNYFSISNSIIILWL